MTIGPMRRWIRNPNPIRILTKPLLIPIHHRIQTLHVASKKTYPSLPKPYLVNSGVLLPSSLRLLRNHRSNSPITRLRRRKTLSGRRRLLMIRMSCRMRH
ncbi:hypothetical protein Gorai_023988 [Gossypium raimondii]|uniref:Uncharacterized protein n=1 Tax=Gossypium raimondii TaxID=29730 RepID=A0A7J8NXS1_GOSRA|nr:hypothetical protein [Gossypium raimondii]